MRAVLATGAGGPEVLAIHQVADPVPGPGEVLVRVVAAGVNRADLMQRQGRYPPPPRASEVIGLECSGTVAAIGPDVVGWSLRDPCVALLAGGGYAELVAVPAGQLLHPPAGVDLVTAAGLVEVAATVVSNLDLVRLSAGETLLVHGGAGGIGSFAIPYAKALDARVICTAGSPEKLDFCHSIGADVAISYRGYWSADVREVTDGRGVDVILDVMGASYLEANVGALAADGRLVVIGLQGGRKGTLDLGRLLATRGAVFVTSLRTRPVEQKAAICARLAEQVWPLLASGRITPAPQTVFALEEVSAAHERLESGQNVGKIVLRIS